MTATDLPNPLPDLDAIETKWLSMCQTHDVGLPGGCNCPQGDPRQTIADLVSELRVRRLDLADVRADRDRLYEQNANAHNALRSLAQAYADATGKPVGAVNA